MSMLIYTCEINYDGISVVGDQYVGFGSHREELLDNLDYNYILKIKDADTGKYIGYEFIVPDDSISNIEILNVKHI